MSWKPARYDRPNWLMLVGLAMGWALAAGVGLGVAQGILAALHHAAAALQASVS